MKKPRKLLITENGFDSFIKKESNHGNFQPASDRKRQVSKTVRQSDGKETMKCNTEDLSANGETQIAETLNNKNETDVAQMSYQSPKTLFRLFVKNGEYVYARPDDIIMIESCDHLVKVYLGIVGKVKLTIRYGTLKDFLSQLPQCQFIRINRFCAINVFRLSGGNSNGQIFEFDFEVSIKLKHFISNAVFRSIGK